MATSASRSEELTPELLQSLREFASAEELQLLEAALAERMATESLPPSMIETVAKTRLEAAQMLGIDERTISKWQQMPGFPGRPGDAGQRNGHYPIQQIEQWRDARQATRAAPDDRMAALRRRHLAASTRKKEVELRIRTGELIALADAQSIIVSAIAAARSELEAWPSKIAEQLGAKRPKLKRWLLRAATKQVRQVLRALEDAVAEDADDRDGGESGSDLRGRATRKPNAAEGRDP